MMRPEPETGTFSSAMTPRMRPEGKAKNHGQAFQPGVLTANDLLSGRAFYRTARGNWTTDFSMAAIIDDPDLAEDLLSGAQSDNSLVGSYIASAATGADGLPRPLHYREIYRAREAAQAGVRRAA